jgi:hypothetical protein
VLVDAGITVSVPLVARAPLHSPDAVQLVALLALHDNVLLPTATDAELAVNDKTGAGIGAESSPEQPPRISEAANTVANGTLRPLDAFVTVML